MTNSESGKCQKAIQRGPLSFALPFIDVQSRIVVVRDQQVILDANVAELYGVETKHVNQAVRNNRDKFPADYVFELTPDEVNDLRSKFLTANVSPFPPHFATLFPSCAAGAAPQPGGTLPRSVRHPTENH